MEAKWYYNGYTPSLQEYIENAWISSSAPTILVHAYFFCHKSNNNGSLGLLGRVSNHNSLVINDFM